MKTLNNMTVRSAPDKLLSLFGTLALITLITACGVDSDDGDVVGSIPLPTDSAITLYCADAGIADETCILDDPDNPYALSPITNDNKFDLNDLAPSAKARFYLWATAQAMNPSGENQYYVAINLKSLWEESGSEVARTQSLRAFRAILDSYFNSVTFLLCSDADSCPIGGTVPVSVRDFVWSQLQSFFDNNTETVREYVSDEWGFVYNETTTEWFRRRD